MKSTLIVCAAPLEFDPEAFDPTDPVAHIAYASHEYQRNLYALAQAGMQWYQYEDGDEELSPIPGFPGRLLASQQRQALAQEGIKAGLSFLPTITPALWNAQSAMIQAQSNYCVDVVKVFNAKFETMEKQPNIVIGGVNEVLELVPGEIVEDWKGKIWSWLTAIVQEMPGPMAFLRVYGWQIALAAYIAWHGYWFLKKYYTKGAAICEAIQAENTQLLALTVSPANFRLRSEIYRQHDDSIQNLLTMILSHERQIQQGGEANFDQWSKIWEQWIERNLYQVDAIIDQLQTLAERETTNLDEVVNVLKQAFITQDEKNADISILMRALLTTPEGVAYLKQIGEKLNDLAYRSESFVFNDSVRIDGKGRVITY